MGKQRANSSEGIETAQPVEVLPLNRGILAGIEYVGMSGISKESQDGVIRLLQYGDLITSARILTCDDCHCLLLTINVGDIVAVKSGFGSGYLGEGPRTFSYVLEVLKAHGVEIEEYTVSPEVIERLDMSALTKADLDAIKEAKPVWPRRWYDYVIEGRRKTQESPWRNFPLVIPFAVIDNRITDLALTFWENPDDRLLTGYRRLEDIVRERSGIDEHGAKLFSKALNPDDGKLTWKNVSDSERVGRMNLFTGAYMAYRNRRAHRESKDLSDELLKEFLLLNHLFSLEKESTEASTT